MSRLLAAVRGWRGLAGQRFLRSDSVPLGPASPGAAALPGVIAGRCGGWEGCGVTGEVGSEATVVREIKRRFGKLPNAFTVLLYLTPSCVVLWRHTWWSSLWVEMLEKLSFFAVQSVTILPGLDLWAVIPVSHRTASASNWDYQSCCVSNPSQQCHTAPSAVSVEWCCCVRQLQTCLCS